MRPSPTACGRCLRALRRSLTTSTSASIDITALKTRPAKFIPDYLTPMPSHLLTTTLNDLLATRPQPSSPRIASPPRALPPGHHLVYFPIQTAPSQLVPDGADPDHSPGAPFVRRMWAGGDVRWREGVTLGGGEWACWEEIEDVSVKGVEGGEKVFVVVVRRYSLGHREVRVEDCEIEERRTLVFMRNQEANTPAPPPRLIRYPHQPDFSVSLQPKPIHLFHFSALTFNAHAIHYNPEYARSVDGHRALLVHGPLTLALMLRVLGDHVSAAAGGSGPDAPSIRSISYRNLAPLYADDKMTVSVRRTDKDEREREQRWDVWVEGPEGGLAVKGSVVVDVKS